MGIVDAVNQTLQNSFKDKIGDGTTLFSHVFYTFYQYFLSCACFCSLVDKRQTTNTAEAVAMAFVDSAKIYQRSLIAWLDMPAIKAGSKEKKNARADDYFMVDLLNASGQQKLNWVHSKFQKSCRTIDKSFAHLSSCRCPGIADPLNENDCFSEDCFQALFEAASQLVSISIDDSFLCEMGMGEKNKNDPNFIRLSWLINLFKQADNISCLVSEILSPFSLLSGSSTENQSPVLAPASVNLATFSSK